jgi:Tfp pilus assembly PilM family ATPase
VSELLRRLFVDPEPPRVAVEVRKHAIGVVRVADSGARPELAAAASLELAEGALRLSAIENNVVDATALRATLRSACERTGVLDGARVALVLPDSVARITLLAAAEVEARNEAETLELIRFRLRKTLPFDAREARVAFRRELDSVLVVAAAAAVLDPYEDACRECGLVPGLVEMSGLALFDAVRASRPSGDRLLVNWDEGYASLLLAVSGAPRLVRTLLGPAAEGPDELMREIQNTLLYYRERLSGAGLAGVSLRAAAATRSDLASWLEGALGVPVEIVDLWARADARLPAQGIAGAAASLFRRVA